MTSTTYSRLIHAILAPLGMSIPMAPAYAATVMIWPIDPHIGAESNGTVLWLENRGDSETVLQIRVKEWKQKDSTDVHADQQDILASPPMVRIKPGVRQMIRLIDATRRPRQGEEAYRVIVDEIPAVTEQQAPVRSSASMIRFQMRYSVPLFVSGKNVPPKAQWAASNAVSLSCSLSTDGKSVTIRNAGPVHARLTDVSFAATPVADGLLGHVLAASQMSWPIPDNANRSAVLSATVNGRKQVTVGVCARE